MYNILKGAVLVAALMLPFGLSAQCGSSIVIGGCGVTYPQTVNLNGAGSWNTNYCGWSTPGMEQVYSFVAPTTGTYSLQITSASGGYVDFGWQASSCAATGWNCWSDVITTGAFGSAYWTVGTTYYILVDAENSSACSYTFYINCAVAAPANDECAGATALTVGATCSYTASTNVGASSSAVADPGCANYSGGDVWFSVVVPASGHLIFNSQANVVTDGGMAVYYGPCGSLTLIECDDDDSPNGLMPMIDLLGLTVGATVYIRFWEYGGDNNGSFSICVYNPATDPCASVTNIASCGTPVTCTPGSGAGSWNTTYCTGGAAAGKEKIYSFTPTTTGAHYIDVTAATTTQDYSYQAGDCQSMGWTCISRGLYTVATYGPMNWTAGVTYYILVQNEVSSAGSQTFAIACPETPGTYTQPTAGLQGTYLGDCMVNTCSGTFTDDGLGGAGFYSNNINGVYRTFCPDATGKCMTATFASMDISSPCCSDYLYVLNGPTQGSPILWVGSGTLAAPSTGGGVWPGAPYTFTSTDQSGCLSFMFTSNSLTNRPGWSINLTCVDCGTVSSNNDCAHATPICGATTVTSASPGPGQISTCSGCELSENYSSWYSFDITHDGRLELDIKPKEFFEDYDFALFEATGCATIGAPIACSYAMAPTYCYQDAWWNGCGIPTRYTTGVSFNTMSNTGTASDLYTDYKVTKTTTVTKGTAYNLNVTSVGTTMHIWAWFDWNKDLDFADAGEAYDLGTGNNVNLLITIPAGASLGRTGFRVGSKRNAEPTACPAAACITAGELEDYSIYITDGTHCSNGVKDGDEIGVDCGGILCTPCENFATNTGMNSTAFDVSEDVLGDSWVAGVPVTAGQTYYLIVNNWSPGAGGFDLVWNFSGGGAMDCSVLPIELINFDATCNNGKVTTHWSTASETNNDFFTVERSEDASNFHVVTIKKGSGTTNTTMLYEVSDPRPVVGNTYYRLKQTDYDGVSTYSDLVSVNCTDDRISFVPNPTQGTLDVTFGSVLEEDVTVSVIDMTGQKVLERNLPKGEYRVTLDLSGLSSGIYYVNITGGLINHQEKVVRE